MDRDNILRLLRQNTAGLRQRGVKELALFGPAARDEGSPGSAVDFILELDPPYTFDHFLEIKLYLGGLLARPVELMIGSPQHPDIQPYIEPDVIGIL